MIADHDECAMGTDTCDQVCINDPGSFHCACNTGYALAANGISCKSKYCMVTMVLLINCLI